MPIGALGPREGHRPIFELFSKPNGGEEGIGHFRCTNPPRFDFHAPDYPSRRPYREGSRRTPAEYTRFAVSWGKRVPQSIGSECNHQAKSVGPRRYIHGGISRWRCLVYVVDDGVVIGCIKYCVANSRLKSLRSRRCCCWLKSGGLGELLEADLHPKILLSSRGNSCKTCSRAF